MKRSFIHYFHQVLLVAIIHGAVVITGCSVNNPNKEPQEQLGLFHTELKLQIQPASIHLNFVNPANDLKVGFEWSKVKVILAINNVSYGPMMCSLTCGTTLQGSEMSISNAINEIRQAISEGIIDNSLLQLKIETQQDPRFEND